MRCSRHVLSRGSPCVDQGHAGEIISQLTWDCLSFPTDALEVAGEKGVWASLLRLLLLCDLALDTSKNWMDGNGHILAMVSSLPPLSVATHCTVK